MDILHEVTILILIDGFLQSNKQLANASYTEVTILILIDGFLQFINGSVVLDKKHKSQSLF